MTERLDPARKHRMNATQIAAFVRSSKASIGPAAWDKVELLLDAVAEFESERDELRVKLEVALTTITAPAHAVGDAGAVQAALEQGHTDGWNEGYVEAMGTAAANADAMGVALRGEAAAIEKKGSAG